MEDEEKCKNNVHEPSPQKVSGLTMEEKSIETLEEVETNSEQCEFVPESIPDDSFPELGDSQLVVSESSVEAKDDEKAVAEKEMSTLDDSPPQIVAKSPIAAEEDAEVVADFQSAGAETAAGVDDGGEKSGNGSDDSQLVGDGTPNVEKDVQVAVAAAVAEEVPSAGAEMETGAEMERLESGLGFDGSQNVGVAVAEGEISTVATEMGTRVGTEMEIKCEVEGVDGVLSESVPGLNESELGGINSPNKDEVVAEMDLENEVETKYVPELEGSTGKSVSELDDSLLLGAESSIAAKEEEDEEAMEKGETGMEDTEMETVAEELENEVGTTSVPQLDDEHDVDAESHIVTRDDEDEDDEGVTAEDEAPMAETEMETETEVAETPEAGRVIGSGGKRKRGKVPKVPARTPRRKVIGEDVCFICFDGGDLVLCDRRNCPKAYHPSCVNRDEAFFKAKGRWNCGWHLCSRCEKSAHYMCLTCTFSLCKTCIKDAVILCVRGNKGFCETCMKTVMLIESNECKAKEDRVDLDDKSSWEYLFKDYWVDLKSQLSLSSVELAQAKNPWKGSHVLAGKQESPEEVFDAINDQGSGSESSENLEVSKRKRRKATKKSKSVTREEVLPSSRAATGAEGTSIPSDTEWASKELLEFVMHMKNGEKSVLSQYDVQALLLEYIKSNKLRDPRRKSQIICDARLENIFGKARVGHFEMLKLLESHFLVKEDSQPDDVQGTVVDTEANHLEADGTIDAPMKGSKDRSRKLRRKGDERGPQSNIDDYAAIDIHNISLIYLRRKLVEDLLEDTEKFHDKVFGTFVRIRISGSNQKQDMYRLVQVVGTRKAEPYKVGKKMADLVLEILNLNKTEVVSIDTISNQEFTEDECKRLRQSIKCGLINPLKVGDILDKAMEIQAARVNDWLESEIVRLSHLRDRASEKGRKKELRECVEKLQLLKTPEERLRRLEEVPKIHADPNMDPSYESEEDDSEMEDNKQEIYMKPRGSSFSRKGREPISPRRGNFSSTDSGSGTRKSSGKSWDINRNLSIKGFPNKGEDATLVGEIANEYAWNQGRDKEANNIENVNLSTNSKMVGQNSHSFARSESFSRAASETSQASLAAGVAETANKINETEKMWHYQDPSGKVQGPFSLVQLRKWNNNRYFPVDLRIWRTTEKQDDSILLTDALVGRLQKELPPVDNKYTNPQTVHSPRISSTDAQQPYGVSVQGGKEGEGGERMNFDQGHGRRSQLELSSSSGWGTPLAEVPKVSANRSDSDYSRNDSLNLPSPTPMSSTPGWAGVQASENKWSSSSFPVQQAGRHLHAVATSDNSGQLTTTSSINQSGSKELTATMESLGVSAPQALWNSGRESLRGSENDSSSSLAVPNSEQGIFIGSASALPTSQSIVTGESHGIPPPVETQQWGSVSVQSQETAAPHQTAGTDTQTWGSASSHNSEPNSSLPVPVQPAAYGQWAGVPSTVQSPAGNFSAPAFSAFPQPDPWRPPMVAGNQSNIQPAAPPNVPWGMGVAPNNNFVPGPRPDNVNTVWVPMPGNPNMGWVGPVPGTTNMNWGAAVQGPVPGMVNPGWVAPTGNPGAMVQGVPPGNANPGWAVPTGNPGSAIQGPLPGNGNPGWVAPAGNPGFNVQGQAQGNVNPGWGAPTGNPGTATVQGPAAGNANPGWGAPAGNSGMRGNDNTHNGNRFSGQRDRGFQNRDSGFGGGRRWNSRPPSCTPKAPDTVCPFHQNGHCKKGAACDMLHT